MTSTSQELPDLAGYDAGLRLRATKRCARLARARAEPEGHLIPGQAPPALVYVLMIITPDVVSRPSLFRSARSARRAAALMWRAENPGTPPGLDWAADEEGDAWQARPADHVRFIITTEAVAP